MPNVFTTEKNEAYESQQKKKLLARLQNLRLIAGETCQSYLLHIERGIVEIMDQVSGVDSAGKKKKPVKSAVVKSCIEVLEGLPIVKAEKGRRRDLSRIEDVVETLMYVISKCKNK